MFSPSVCHFTNHGQRYQSIFFTANQVHSIVNIHPHDRFAIDCDNSIFDLQLAVYCRTSLDNFDDSKSIDIIAQLSSNTEKFCWTLIIN